MRHLNKKVHLNRSKAHRKALLGNLSAALFQNKRIVTTLAKAKYARSFAERMINFARRGEVADRRHVLKYVGNKIAVKTLFDDLGPHFKNRDGGYTRIIKLGPRKGDADPMAMLKIKLKIKLKNQLKNQLNQQNLLRKVNQILRKMLKTRQISRNRKKLRQRIRTEKIIRNYSE